MNDRFRFRVWDNNKKEYLDKGYIHRKGYLVMPTMKNDYSLAEAEGDFVIEQCTGLKDKNGRLIYEGDFLKDHNGIWQVLWNENEAAFYIYNKKRDFYLSPFIGEFEVIGNIHKNPELMEVEE